MYRYSVDVPGYLRVRLTARRETVNLSPPLMWDFAPTDFLARQVCPSSTVILLSRRLPSRDVIWQIVRPVALAAEGEGPGMPSHSTLAAALFAACAASRPGDAAAVLFVMEDRGSGGAGVRDEGGRTPLHHACRGDNVDLVRLLCQAGADPEARDYQARCTRYICRTARVM